MNFFNRCWQFKIQIEDQPPKIYQRISQDTAGLHITFQSEAVLNSIPPSGTITITGLPLSDITYLATSFIPDSGMLKKASVELQAGYDGNLSVVVIGNVCQATPNFTTSDYSIQLKIINGLQLNQLNAFASVSLKGNATLRDILANIASKNNLVLDLDPSLNNRVLYDYSYQGSPFKQLASLRTYYNDLELDIQGNKLIARHKKSTRPVRYKLTSKSGLLGDPAPSPIGCNITTYLLPNLQVGDIIELETKKLYQLNGFYKINKITHKGESRGTQWQSEMLCQLYSKL